MLETEQVKIAGHDGIRYIIAREPEGTYDAVVVNIDADTRVGVIRGIAPDGETRIISKQYKTKDCGEGSKHLAAFTALILQHRDTLLKIPKEDLELLIGRELYETRQRSKS